MSDGEEYVGMEPDENESFTLQMPPTPEFVWYVNVPFTHRMLGKECRHPHAIPLFTGN